MTAPSRLGPADAAAYRALRLEALRLHPEAFAADWAEEAARPLDWFTERLATNAVWGAGEDAALAGMVGLMRPGMAKLHHKAIIWGFYVRADARSAGLGTALLGAALTEAREAGAEEVRLSVTAGNAAALRLYERLGFRAYGREPRALRVAGHDHDEFLMALRLV
ncbi:GNAT family N-acetyltransferase [Belnapia sp. T6]|uniref:GNAT family N-acetyltransferase n=1 Tax=Belnapia mucosa TaxID=2804532 RepID=A0ABS1UYH3_9PROT|nr:GNAT family N-acetyltransferase [Belnapia mucosa]MBL6454514.1 GNAT family N-acetyltransferase [Belnapia mucosa]